MCSICKWTIYTRFVRRNAVKIIREISDIFEWRQTIRWTVWTFSLNNSKTEIYQDYIFIFIGKRIKKIILSLTE